MKRKILLSTLILCLSFTAIAQTDLVIDYIIPPSEYYYDDNEDYEKKYVCVGIKNTEYQLNISSIKIKVSDADISYAEASKEIRQNGGYIHPEKFEKKAVCKEDKYHEVEVELKEFVLMPHQSKMIKIDIGDWELYNWNGCKYGIVDLKVEIIWLEEAAYEKENGKKKESYGGDNLKNNVGYLFMFD